MKGYAMKDNEIKHRIIAIITKFSKDNIAGFAAQTSFYIILSLFPFIIVLLTLLQYLPISYKDFTVLLQQLLPEQVHSFIDSIVSELFNHSSMTLTFISLIFAIWAAGKGFMSMVQGFNTIYEVKENRNFIIQRLLASLYTLIFIAIIILSLVLLVFGEQLILFIQAHIPQIAPIFSAIFGKKEIFFIMGLILFFMIIYTVFPNRKTSLIKELPGAILASVGWYAFSICYSLYVNLNANFSYMYGSLTTVMFSFIWLYGCMMIIFFGSELNSFIEQKLLVFKFHRENRDKTN